MASRPGLRWEDGLFEAVPRWIHAPDIGVIEHIVSKTLAQTCRVSFFCQGAFNKLYNVQCESSYYLMRVSLPVDPKFKTLSEVATLSWIQQHTSIPVPRVVAYNCSHENELGFEWILMEKIAGRPLEDVWRSMTWEQKKRLSAKVAYYSAELFSKKHAGIGNLFFSNRDGDCTESVLGRIVSMPFFWDNHFLYKVHRGPFNSSSEWLQARLQFNQLDCEKTIRESSDEDDIEEAEKTSPVVSRLFKAIGLIFADDKPQMQQKRMDSQIPTVLLHDDLSWHNILVDDDGELQGIIDWECTSAMPLWKAAQIPQFLQGSQRMEKPKRELYSANEGGGNLFHIHLFEYEQTQLRDIFMSTMKQASPDWAYIFESSRKQADLDIAIQSCDLHNLARKSINEWLDELEKGEEPTSLVKFLQ
ncbi:hypothetical protein FQN57_006552 [Myotisia sp. PD_48]|nr:hypothetical protein FQN57_006552 [Myotisia sp. PD_48]